ncbi:hypothetical protein BCR33DRAFT_835919 [Rhizoclosmatium globosum]|uniref:Uncharacterized protein n=1 Tax=Rhizoclosmatium globosum TaxID=329046 RepID=A0A1Y2BN10_9FUNG|nr:hypothetical protein BCR33DRAFT_835919 [Rhizoclosmatium globosum]|eukprot:ORY36100.1 hypothetical protein BCR33DRAFT_835919 [Rhizoclosmatium globosum]
MKKQQEPTQLKQIPLELSFPFETRVASLHLRSYKKTQISIKRHCDKTYHNLNMHVHEPFPVATNGSYRVLPNKPLLVSKINAWIRYLVTYPNSPLVQGAYPRWKKSTLDLGKTPLPSLPWKFGPDLGINNFTADEVKEAEDFYLGAKEAKSYSQAIKGMRYEGNKNIAWRKKALLWLIEGN